MNDQSLFVVFFHYTNLFPQVNRIEIGKNRIFSSAAKPKSFPFPHMYKRSFAFPENLGQDDGIFLLMWKTVDFIALA
ncbi:MAG: hypothetical protein ACI3XG_02240 [Faecousia sp.]